MDCFEVIPRRIVLFGEISEQTPGSVVEVDIADFTRKSRTPVQVVRDDIDRMSKKYGWSRRVYRCRTRAADGKIIVQRTV